MLKLTPKQERFVDEYLTDLNATQAAIRAGYSKKTAGRQAIELLNKTHIAHAVAEKKKQIANGIEVTRDRIIKEMARLAFFNIKGLVDSEGNPKQIHELSDDVAAAINGIEITVIGGQEEQDAHVKKYRIPDKNKSLENLAKILGYMDRDTGSKDSAELLAEAMNNLADRLPS